MNSYYCISCGGSFKALQEPNFCPVCGKSDLRKGTYKAIETAFSTIADCIELSKELAEAWENYIKLLAVYEDKMQLLRVYKKRGIIKEEEIPRYADFKSKGIAQAVKEYRKDRRDSIETIKNS